MWCDHDALRVQLFVALAVGLNACSGDTSSGPQPHTTPVIVESEVQTEAKTVASSGPDMKAESRLPDPEPDSAEDQATGTATPVLPSHAAPDEGTSGDGPRSTVDPTEYCAAPRQLLTVSEALAKRHPWSKDELGCARSTGRMQGRGRMVGVLDTAKTQALRDAGDPEHCCYRVSRRHRGRLLMVGDRAWLPAFELGAQRSSAAPLDSRVARRVAAAWLHDARLEWASVCSFDRAAAELRALGAPDELVERYYDAARDERRHTAQCIRWAEHYARRAIRLAALPAVAPRPGDRAACLRRTFIEGCVAETAATLVAARSARRSSGTIATTLRQIAADEAEHASLAWTTVGWILARCTTDERAQFVSWTRRQRPEPATGGLDLDTDHGRLSRASEHAITTEAWDRCIMPLLDRLESALASPSSTARGCPAQVRASS